MLVAAIRRALGVCWLATAMASPAACSRPGQDGAGSSLPEARSPLGTAPGVTEDRQTTSRGTGASSPSSTPVAPSAVSGAPASGVAEVGTRPRAKPDTAAYPWHTDPSVQPLAAVDRLEDRFPPPAGFTRVALGAGSFGAWLRDLPLAAPGTPVLSYDGRVLRTGDDPRVAAVVTLDVGKADLQQCADAVIRMHAEWSWSRGEPKVSYRAASGVAMPWERWARGERVKQHGQSIDWEASARAASDHATFRKYLDAVFSWANTVSLSRQAKAVAVEDMRPGDFMILPGGPGHSVLVLDMARGPDGRRAVLLGQSYMPAQSYHVLRPASQEAWFAVDPASEGIQTPFWPVPFPWTSIRRLD